MGSSNEAGYISYLIVLFAQKQNPTIRDNMDYLKLSTTYVLYYVLGTTAQFIAYSRTAYFGAVMYITNLFIYFLNNQLYLPIFCNVQGIKPTNPVTRFTFNR